jgi:hypothetical protein
VVMYHPINHLFYSIPFIFQLFIQSKVNNVDPPPTEENLPNLKQKYLDKWKKMPEEKKVKWIEYCLSEFEEYLNDLKTYQESHPGYILKKGLNIKQLLTREEIIMWEAAHGKPAPPKSSVFDVFYEEFSSSEDLHEMDETERRSLATEKWNEMYRMKFQISKVEYKRQIQTFFASLPPFMKDWCLSRVHKNFWKICHDVDKVPLDAEDLNHSDCKTSIFLLYPICIRYVCLITEHKF